MAPAVMTPEDRRVLAKIGGWTGGIGLVFASVLGIWLFRRGFDRPVFGAHAFACVCLMTMCLAGAMLFKRRACRITATLAVIVGAATVLFDLVSLLP